MRDLARRIARVLPCPPHQPEQVLALILGAALLWLTFFLTVEPMP